MSVMLTLRIGCLDFCSASDIAGIFLGGLEGMKYALSWRKAILSNIWIVLDPYVKQIPAWNYDIFAISSPWRKKAM
jgi:hypothetical protein